MVGNMVACRQTWYWLHLDQKATGNRMRHQTVFWAYMRSQSPPPQWCTSSNKAIPTPTSPHLLILPLLWDYGGHLYSNYYMVPPTSRVGTVTSIYPRKKIFCRHAHWPTLSGQLLTETLFPGDSRLLGWQWKSLPQTSTLNPNISP